MAYRKGGYRIEEYEMDREKYYAIRWRNIDDKMTAIVSDDGTEERWNTEEEAIEAAEKLVERGFGD